MNTGAPALPAFFYRRVEILTSFPSTKVNFPRPFGFAQGQALSRQTRETRTGLPRNVQ
jgi:hypothetical protein